MHASLHHFLVAEAAGDKSVSDRYREWSKQETLNNALGNRSFEDGNELLVIGVVIAAAICCIAIFSWLRN
jgi:uncharacterized membrane protein YraQ (UPF0718 family)